MFELSHYQKSVVREFSDGQKVMKVNSNYVGNTLHWYIVSKIFGIYLSEAFGAKYLFVFSFRSLKTREKYISFAQFVYF